jgi:hypothetical protein
VTAQQLYVHYHYPLTNCSYETLKEKEFILATPETQFQMCYILTKDLKLIRLADYFISASGVIQSFVHIDNRDQGFNPVLASLKRNGRIIDVIE